MSGKVFYDTNILVYAHDGSSPGKQALCQALVKRGLRERTMALSTQVFSEFFVVATRKLGLDATDALREMHLLSRAHVVEPTLAMVFESVGLAASQQLSFWDALIVVSAASAGADVLYTEDLTHGQTIRGVLVENPFQPEV